MNNNYIINIEKRNDSEIMIDTVEGKNLEVMIKKNIVEIQSMIDNGASVEDLYSNSKRLSITKHIFKCNDDFDKKKLFAKYVIYSSYDVLNYLVDKGFELRSRKSGEIYYNLFIGN